MEKEIVLKYKTLAQEQIRIFGKKFVINNKNTLLRQIILSSKFFWNKLIAKLK